MTDETTNALRAVAHPVRLRMLSLLTGTELSAAEVARELGITHANASYHLRTLLDAGELVIASEEKIRGGVAKRYRHPWEEGAARQSPKQVGTLEDRTLYVRVMAEELVRRVAACRRSAPARTTPTPSSGSPPRTTPRSMERSTRPRWRCTPPPGRRAPRAPSGSA